MFGAVTSVVTSVMLTQHPAYKPTPQQKSSEPSGDIQKSSNENDRLVGAALGLALGGLDGMVYGAALGGAPGGLIGGALGSGTDW